MYHSKFFEKALFSFSSLIYKELFKMGKKEVGIGLQRIIRMTEEDIGSCCRYFFGIM